MSNKKKSDQLGMSYGSASHRLRKIILFKLLQDAGLDVCFQCGKRILKIEELSIEHKIPWLDSEDPVALFFDLGNIAFSHLKCNTANRRSNPVNKGMWEHGRETGYKKYGCRCELCVRSYAERRKTYPSRRSH